MHLNRVLKDSIIQVLLAVNRRLDANEFLGKSVPKEPQHEGHIKYTDTSFLYSQYFPSAQ